MDKSAIDKKFVAFLPTLKPIVLGLAYKANKKLDADLVINEGYLHLIKNMGKLNDETEVEKMIVNFVKQNITWYNSSINKQERVNSITSDYTPVELSDEDDIDLDNKIEIEKWYNEKQAILATYRAQEKDKLKQIIFDCYFKKNITKGVHLAKHLKINKDYSCRYIREMKEDIQKFYEDYTKYNEKQ